MDEDNPSVIQYTKVVRLIPQSTTLEQYLLVCCDAFNKKQTVAFSADDTAGILALPNTANDSLALAYGDEAMWGGDILAWLLERDVQNVEQPAWPPPDDKVNIQVVSDRNPIRPWLWVDLSVWNGGVINWRRVAEVCQGVILKATQGKSFVDPVFAERIEAAVEAGLNVDVYHYMDRSGTPDEQAQNFWDTIESNIDNIGTVWLDFEWWRVENEVVREILNVGEALQFREEMLELSGRTCGWYTGYYYLNAVSQFYGSQTARGNTELMNTDGSRWWVAGYVFNDSSWNYEDGIPVEPDVDWQPFLPEWLDRYHMWQFASNGAAPGISSPPLNLNFRDPSGVTLIDEPRQPIDVPPVTPEPDPITPVPTPVPPPPGGVDPTPDPGEGVPVDFFRAGLHASVGGNVTQGEIALHQSILPNLTKVITRNRTEDVRRLAVALPGVPFVIGLEQDNWNAETTPQQFVNNVLPSLRQHLNTLGQRSVLIELHTEPNLRVQGWGISWQNGTQFGEWYNNVAAILRDEGIEAPFIVPGLHPAGGIPNVSYETDTFFRQMMRVVSDYQAIGIHKFWGASGPLNSVINDVKQAAEDTRNFGRPLIVTEASNDAINVSRYQKGQSYRQFVDGLKDVDGLYGVTFLVAASNDPDFARDVWTGATVRGYRGDTRIVGINLGHPEELSFI